MNRQEIIQLQQYRSYPSLTITLPTHRTSPDNRQDPIRLRSLVKTAKDQLLAEFSRREIGILFEKLDEVVKSVRFRYTLDGLVIFVNKDYAAKHYLPFSLPERVVVADNFLTRDLVFAMNRTPRYWVLSLSEKPTRLYEGTHDTLIEIQGSGFPMVHEGPGGEQSLPGGVGVNKSAYRDERHRQFFRAVDNAFASVMANDPLPLAVVGVNRFQAFFDEVTAHKDSIVATLNGSHDKTTPSRLAKLVWLLVKEGLAQQRKKYLDQLEKAVGERKVYSSIGEIWRAANEGRGRLLLVEEDFHFPGRLDPSGVHLLPADDPTQPDVIPDAVDDIIETVLSKQGQVVFVPDGQLATFQRIAMVLRY